MHGGASVLKVTEARYPSTFANH